MRRGHITCKPVPRHCPHELQLYPWLDTESHHCGKPKVCPRKRSPSPRGSTGAQPWTSLVSIREAESPSLHFSTGLVCKQERESRSRHESIFQISLALQPRSSYSAPVTAVTHLTASHQREHSLALQLFLKGTQQYGGFNPGLLALLPNTMLRAKIPEGKHPRSLEKK